MSSGPHVIQWQFLFMSIRFDICPVYHCELFLNSHIYVPEKQFIYTVSDITTLCNRFYCVSHTIVLMCTFDWVGLASHYCVCQAILCCRIHVNEQNYVEQEVISYKLMQYS